jgi:hypothetical protein
MAYRGSRRTVRFLRLLGNNAKWLATTGPVRKLLAKPRGP